jgi:hypothetical protein
MKKLIAGLLVSCLVTGVAYAESTRGEVTGVPIYQGPEYSTIDSQQRDINNMPPEFHAFHHRGVDEVGYSPLTLEDFRLPVPGRANKEFRREMLSYPEKSVTVYTDKYNGLQVTSFFFTRDMVRDHIQRLIDTYYICEPDLVQQVIDYYAEVTPQCGEAITWVWFHILEDNHKYRAPDTPTGREENRYFGNYLSNFKDKFYLEFGLPKVQAEVDEAHHEFLYQYMDRGKYNCGPEFKAIKGCKDGNCGGCGSCADKCTTCKPQACDSCKASDCGGCGSCDQLMLPPLASAALLT